MNDIPLFSAYALKTRLVEDLSQLFDPLRKRWVADTPEERVRQGLARHIQEVYEVSPALIAIEREIDYYRVKKRFDLVVFDGEAKPWLVCECKAPTIRLTQEVLYQIGRYNAVLKAPHMLVTNGKQWLFFSLNDEGSFTYIPKGWAS